jgi:hypothetical protein
MSDNTYKHLGIDIQQIGLIAFDRSEDSFIDIKAMCFEVSIFENIESSAVSIEVGIEDGIGIIERMPLVGDEKIVITYRTPSFNDYVEAEFDVYEHSVINKTKERVREYVIYGVSPEKKLDLVSSVDRIYKLSGSQTVESVYGTYFRSQSQLKNPKKLETSESFGTQYFIGNGRSPMSFIKHIADESESEKYPASNYMFYETLDRKFHFKTLDELMKGEVVQNFYLADAGKSLGDVKRRAEKDTIFPYQVITDIEVKDGINGLRKISGGGYRNSVKVIDPVTKTFSEKTFNYLKDDKLVQIAKYKTIPNKTSFLQVNDEDIHSRLLRGTVIPDGLSTGYFEDTGISSDTEFDEVQEIELDIPEIIVTSERRAPEDRLQGTFFEENVSEESDPQYFFPRRRHRFAHLDVASRMLFDTIIINCTVSGISDLHVGQVVNVFVPQESNDEEMMRMYNLFYGGDRLKGGEKDAKFLITKVHHAFSFSKAIYTTSFTCVKNSFANRVETESKRVAGDFF